MINKILNGDCLELMKAIPDKSVDMILCDLPYSTTKNQWDIIIPFEPLWVQYERVIKNKGAIVLTAQTPFDKVLGVSNLKLLKYEWIWEKEAGTGFLNAKKYPLKSHENILVFCKNTHVYNPQMVDGKPYVIKKGGGTNNYNKDSKDNITTVNEGERYPKTILRFSRDKNKLHPTQKPVALFEYLIRTYTNTGETVLDNCSGSGTTAIACINTNRRYICIEKDPEYFALSVNRVNDHLEKLYGDLI